jgi:hypothetical protein
MGWMNEPGLLWAPLRPWRLGVENAANEQKASTQRRKDRQVSPRSFGLGQSSLKLLCVPLRSWRLGVEKMCLGIGVI